MKQTARLLIAGITATTLAPAIATAQSSNQGYLVDSRGVIVRSGSGLCWEHRDPDVPPAQPTCNPVRTPPPTPVAAPAPAPAPSVAVAAPRAEPAKVMSKKFSYSGDTLFAFDQAVLTADGRTTLDALVRQLENASYDKVVVIGHTDRLGSTKYNQGLSERRAQSVKEYLVTKNIPADRIQALGKGEAEPVTVAGDCRGGKSQKVIACLRPDRRVSIEVTGTTVSGGS